MNTFQVRPVLDRGGVEEFIRAARRAESSNPQWIEQLHDEVRQIFASRSIFLKRNAVQPFVAYRSGEPVGRIVATVDAAQQQKYNDRCGFFGFVEAPDDPRCFAALFQAAESFLREKGMALSRGPFGLNINGESGLLVEGFNEAHILQTNHCPPYYSTNIEALGYEKATDLYSFICSVRNSNVPERVEREVARGRMPKIDIRSAAYRSFFRDLHMLVDFYNDAWAENQWALPMSREEVDFLGRMILPVVKPRWINFAWYNGELVSVIAQFPDINEALAGLQGKLFPTGLAKILWRVHVRGTRRARVMLAATAKKWRDTFVGIAAMGQLMAKSISDARAAGIEEIECGWILESNRAAISPVINLPARRSRVFRIYERQL